MLKRRGAKSDGPRNLLLSHMKKKKFELEWFVVD